MLLVLASVRVSLADSMWLVDTRSMTTIRLSPAEQSQISQLRQWFTSLEELQLWGGPAMGWARTEQDWYRMINWPQCPSFLMHEGPEFIGFGQVRYLVNDSEADCCHLARLIISPGSRGRGFGEQLIKRLMQQGERLWRAQAYSLYVYQHNEPAIKLYRKLGFQPEGCYEGFEKVLRMVKRG
ncbi:GNAT family N-acetyltransferase [Corallincola platygyrae]|uniref:GNAT family N-acetyltransferase n=1 Tax=Corallincola platygyrae TaxID=1193278 RepID=A0ABW4XT57_9GAMM